MTKRKIWIMIAVIIALVGVVIASVGVENLTDKCYEHTFTVVMLDSNLGLLKTTINGKEIIPNNGGDIANGYTRATVTTWYNETDNTVMTNYYMDTYGLLIIGLLICAGAAGIYFGTKPKRKYY